MITIGSMWQWVPDRPFDACEIVTVVGKRRGGWKLSNGWVVDESGVAEGTGRFPGGHIRHADTLSA